MKAIAYIGVALIGLIGGLLVNYLADVLPIHRRLARPNWWPYQSASHLGKYFAQSRVIFVLLSMLGLAAALYKNPIDTWSIWELSIILLYFAAVIVIDIEHRLILHSLSLTGAVVLGAIGILRHGLLVTVMGGLAGFAILLGLYWLGGLFANWIAKRRGEPLEEIVLGFGDVNLAGVIGLLSGWPAVLGALFLGILLGGVYSLGHILVALARGRYRPFAALPYGPFLSLGAVLLIALRAYFS